jgi:hypothetical protein
LSISDTGENLVYRQNKRRIKMFITFGSIFQNPRYLPNRRR